LASGVRAVAGKAEEEFVLVARATTTTRPDTDPGSAQPPGVMNTALSSLFRVAAVNSAMPDTGF